MTSIPDNELLSDAERVRGKVVLVTGAASGFGRASALIFARHGAKLVIADRDTKGAEKVVNEIEELGSQAIAHTCDVTSWEQQLKLFQRIIEEHGAVDVVVANAGIVEKGSFAPAEVDANNVPVKPNLLTMDVNIKGVLYTTYLAQHYLLLDHQPGALKSLVLIGSMSSFVGIPFGTLYTTSKHAIIGLQRSLYGIYSDKIRITTICPWFADTRILITPLKIFLAGIPLTPVERVAGAIVKAATDANSNTNGAVYTLPDHGETFRLDREHFALDTGVYQLLSDRAETLLMGYSKVLYYFRTVVELAKIGGFKLLIVALLPLIFLGWTKGVIPPVLEKLQSITLN